MCRDGSVYSHFIKYLNLMICFSPTILYEINNHHKFVRLQKDIDDDGDDDCYIIIRFIYHHQGRH